MLYSLRHYFEKEKFLVGKIFFSDTDAYRKLGSEAESHRRAIRVSRLSRQKPRIESAHVKDDAGRVVSDRVEERSVEPQSGRVRQPVLSAVSGRLPVVGGLGLGLGALSGPLGERSSLGVLLRGPLPPR